MINGLKVVAAPFHGASADALRAMCDELRGANTDAVVVLAGIDGEKVTFAVAVGAEAQKKAQTLGKLRGPRRKRPVVTAAGVPILLWQGAKKPDLVGAALDTAVETVAEMTNGK